jgi:hypothetical protein
VGKSLDVIGRYQQHMNGQGSAWTKKYKPMSLLESRDGVSPFEEDKVVKEYMAKYGIENVRGGAYVTEELDEVQEYSLQKEIWAAKDCCTECGRKGHWAKTCNATTDINGNSLCSWECENCSKEFDDKKECEEHERSCGRRVNTIYSENQCYSCGKYGHYATSCYKNIYKSKKINSSDNSDLDESDYESYDSD